jgi:hypothetical protein
MLNVALAAMFKKIAQLIERYNPIHGIFTKNLSCVNTWLKD